MKRQKLEPPDFKRCQAEKPNGYSFMTLGGQPALVRCSNRPTVIATERVKGKDGLRGSMSLCPDCLDVMLNQSTTPACTIRKIKSRSTRRLIHTEQGTPSQVTQAWDRLAREEREPS